MRLFSLLIVLVWKELIEDLMMKIYLTEIFLRKECFSKIVLSIGDFKKGKVKWIPTEDDLEIIWHIISRLDHEDLNRLYYKNNLYGFIDNKAVTNALVYLLSKLEEPFLNPGKAPKEIEFELDAFTDMLREYVMYNHHWIDAADRCDNMIKNVTLLSDTDSAIVCLETWRAVRYK